jgi:hypothetical protein
MSRVIAEPELPFERPGKAFQAISARAVQKIYWTASGPVEAVAEASFEIDGG